MVPREGAPSHDRRITRKVLPFADILTRTLRLSADALRAYNLVSATDGGVEMRVVDTGRGFDLTQVLRTKKGVGLVSIQERVRWLGGKVVIQSQPGKGAELTVFIPLNTLAPWAVPAA